MVLSLDLIRTACKSKGQQLGPILVLSYKNHALDEFLLDVLMHAGIKTSSGNTVKNYLIRAGKAENEELYNYAEKKSSEEADAQKELNSRIIKVRHARSIEIEWKSTARKLHRSEYMVRPVKRSMHSD